MPKPVIQIEDSEIDEEDQPGGTVLEGGNAARPTVCIPVAAAGSKKTKLATLSPPKPSRVKNRSKNEVFRSTYNKRNQRALEESIGTFRAKALSQRTRRTVLTEKAFFVAQALYNYTRRVDCEAGCLFETDEELNSDLTQEAEELLQGWREGIRENDEVDCCDWVDEFECNDESRGWVKMYSIRVETYAAGGETVMKLDEDGDETDEVDFILPKDHPGAIYVHFHGFEDDDKWIHLTESHIMPKGAHKKSVDALEKYNVLQKRKMKRAVLNSQNSPQKRRKVYDASPKADKCIEVIQSTRNDNFAKIDDSRTGEHDLMLVDGGRNSPLSIDGGVTTSAGTSVDGVADEVSAKTKRDPEVTQISANDLLMQNVGETPKKLPPSPQVVAQDPGVDSRINERQTIKTPVRNLTSTKKRSATKSSGKKKKSKKPSQQTNTDIVEQSWICVECKESECNEDSESHLVICEGECKRPFHVICAGLEDAPTKEETWTCEDCQRKKHQCAICGEFGEDDKDVFLCKKRGCGMFYHESCLSMYDIEIDATQIDDFDAKNPEDFPRPKFVCPAHKCLVCCSDHVNAKFATEAAFQPKAGPLYRCLECPNSFHIGCIPPAARFHELALLCPEHRDSKLPYIDIENSMQMAYSLEVDRKRDKLNASIEKKNSIGTGTCTMKNDIKVDASKGDGFIPLNINVFGKMLGQSSMESLAFRAPNNFRDDVHSKPPQYVNIHTLRYGSKKPKRLPPSEGGTCHCIKIDDDDAPSCGVQCLNRVSMVECIGGPTKRGGSGEKNPYWNCNCGPKCGNRRIGTRQIARCRPKREGGKGWGLIALDGVQKDDLVLEYVGEVIDEQTKDDRLAEWSKEHPNDPNFYIMELQPGWFIDARVLGNMSRFINHSCDPNCALIPMNVGGYMRIGIFCTKEVAPGEFLSYDYRFDTRDGSKFACLCGAENCRGTMKGGVKNESAPKVAESKTKKQLIVEAKQRIEKDLKFLTDVKKSEKNRLNSTGLLIPGASSEGGQTVANGPQSRLKRDVQEYRVCLWRNVVVGANFYGRYWRRNSTKYAKKKVAGVDRISRLPQIDVLQTFAPKG